MLQPRPCRLQFTAGRQKFRRHFLAGGQQGHTGRVGPYVLRCCLACGIGQRHGMGRAQQRFGDRAPRRARGRQNVPPGQAARPVPPRRAAQRPADPGRFPRRRGWSWPVHWGRRPSPAQSRQPAGMPRPLCRSAIKFYRCHVQKAWMCVHRVPAEAHDFCFCRSFTAASKRSSRARQAAKGRAALLGQPPRAAV